MTNKNRDLLGNVCYYAESQTKLKFKVFKNYEGKFYIINCTGWTHSPAMVEDIDIDGEQIFLWGYAPSFPNFTQAVRYLKENLECLY